MKNLLIVLGIFISSLIGWQIAHAALSDDINNNIARDNQLIKIQTLLINRATASLKNAQNDLAIQQADLPEALNIETQLNVVASQPSQSVNTPGS